MNENNNATRSQQESTADAADAGKREEQRRQEMARADQARLDANKAVDLRKQDVAKSDLAKADVAKADLAKVDDARRLDDKAADARRAEGQRAEERKGDEKKATQSEFQVAKPIQSNMLPEAPQRSALAEKRAQLRDEVSKPDYRFEHTNIAISDFRPEEQKAFDEAHTKRAQAIGAEQDPVKQTEMRREAQVLYHEHYAQKKELFAHQAERPSAKDGKLTPHAPGHELPEAERMRAEAQVHRERALALREAKTKTATKSETLAAPKAGKVQEAERNFAHERTVARNEATIAANTAEGKTVPPERTRQRAAQLDEGLTAAKEKNLAKAKERTQERAQENGQAAPQ